MSLTRCLQSCATERTTEPDIAETERVRTRLVDLMAPHLWTAVCMSQATERLSTISMYRLCSIMSCLCQCCTHNSSSFLVTHFAHFHTTHLLNPSTQLLFTPSTQLLFFTLAHKKRCKHDRDRAQRNTRWRQPNSVSNNYPQETVHPARQQESSIHTLLASRSRSQVKLRNGQRGISRSRRSRVQRMRGCKKSSTLLHGKAQTLWSTAELLSLSTAVLRARDEAQRTSSGDGLTSCPINLADDLPLLPRPDNFGVSPLEWQTICCGVARRECDELDHHHWVGHRREHRGATRKEREQHDHGSRKYMHERGPTQVRESALVEVASR